MKTTTIITFCLVLLFCSTGITVAPAHGVKPLPKQPNTEYQKVIDDINFWNETSRKTDSIARAAGINLK